MKEKHVLFTISRAAADSDSDPLGRVRTGDCAIPARDGAQTAGFACSSYLSESLRNRL
jgi:hypothetical protein